jgi:hypothetical protein
LRGNQKKSNKISRNKFEVSFFVLEGTSKYRKEICQVLVRNSVSPGLGPTRQASAPFGLRKTKSLQKQAQLTRDYVGAHSGLRAQYIFRYSTGTPLTWNIGLGWTPAHGISGRRRS